MPEENKIAVQMDVEKASSDTASSSSRRRLESMSDEEIIKENLKDIMDKKSREERKANGRLIAAIVAFLVIFLAIYHAWIRKNGFAGLFIPAVIMLSYAAWVVVLAKRDKRRRALFEKHIEEVALKNKTELEEKAKLKQLKKCDKSQTSLHHEDETASNASGHKGEYRKHRKPHKRSNQTKDLRAKRPSIRQKLFRQKPPINPLPQVIFSEPPTSPGNTQPKRKQLQRLDALAAPKPLERMSSAP